MLIPVNQSQGALSDTCMLDPNMNCVCSGLELSIIILHVGIALRRTYD